MITRVYGHQVPAMGGIAGGKPLSPTALLSLAVLFKRRLEPTLIIGGWVCKGMHPETLATKIENSSIYEP